MKPVSLCVIGLLAGLLLQSRAFGQLQTTNWYFGDSAGIAFHSGQAKKLTNSAMFASEACASISDDQGNLLFYTNGKSIWNSNHQMMPNGNSIKGSLTARQGAIIFPGPGSDSLYHAFFTAGLGGDEGLTYSRINMNKANGTGDVTLKNHQLHSPTTERLAGTIHENNTDYWLISLAWGTDTFYVYPVTSTGPGDPVISTSAFRHSFDNDILPSGTMKINPQGDLIALTMHYFSEETRIELYRFNRQSGKLSFLNAIKKPDEFSTGLEFSPKGEKLYVSYADTLIQYNIAALPDINAVKQSAHTIATTISKDLYDFGALQLAPDGKIYHVNHPQKNFDPPRASSPLINAIQYPDADTSACAYAYEHLDLSPGEAVFGLPAFLSHWFKHPAIAFNQTCMGDTTYFRFLAPHFADSVNWRFHDPHGEQIHSGADSAAFRFSRADSFLVQALIYKGLQTDTQNQRVIVRPSPNINIGPDTLICGQDSLTLNAKPESTNQTGEGIFTQNTYQWSHTESNAAQQTIYEAGQYHVWVSNDYGCQATDTMQLKRSPLPRFDLGNDTTLCYPDSCMLNPDVPEGTYTWQDQTHQPRYEVEKPGKYILNVQDTAGCSFTDSITIDYYHAPYVDFPSDTLLCFNETLTLEVQHPEHASITWHDGKTSADYQIRKRGKYWVTAQNFCGKASDTIRVRYKSCEPVKIPNVFTPNKDGRNDLFQIRGIRGRRASLIIFNRWGKKVYASSNYANTWDGANLPAGVYFYILHLPEENQNFKGFLHLLR